MSGEPGTFKIAVREDRMAAMLAEITPPEDGGTPVSAADIEATLKEQGITFGIDAKAIEKTAAEAATGTKTRTNVLIAQGKPPVQGKAAEFEFRVGPDAANKDPQACYLVKPGQVLAVKAPATEGAPGTNVLGEEVPCPPGEEEEEEEEWAVGENVSAPGDGGTFVSELYGIAKADDDTVSVASGVRISEEGLSAHVLLCPFLSDNSTLATADVLDALGKAGVVHGALEDDIAAALEPGQGCREIQAAKATPAQDGTNASITFLFQTAKSAGALDETSGRVDYKERGTLQTVQAGALLAEKTPPTAGEDGTDIFGKITPAKPGVDTELTVMEGVAVSADGLRYTAEKDGVVTLIGGNKIGAFQHYEVPGDVDYTTGNLAMDGTLSVKGWVRSGFVVRASGDLYVGGGIEDASVEAGGSVEVTGGIIGKDAGHTRAVGDIRARFLESACVEAEGDIVVRESVMQSTVSAGGRFLVTEGKGRVVGGTAEAQRGVEVNILGSEAEASTFVNVGIDAETLQQLEVLQKELNMYRRNKRKVALSLAALGRKAKQRTITKREAGQFARLAKCRREAVIKESKLAKSKKALAQAVERRDGAVAIVVRRAVYGGTVVTLMGHRFPVKDDIQEGGRFVLDTKDWVVKYLA